MADGPDPQALPPGEGAAGRSLPLSVRLLGAGVRSARSVGKAAGIDRAVESAAEEAIVAAIESEAVERALVRVLQGPLVDEADALGADRGADRIVFLRHRQRALRPGAGARRRPLGRPRRRLHGGLLVARRPDAGDALLRDQAGDPDPRPDAAKIAVPPGRPLPRRDPVRAWLPRRPLRRATARLAGPPRRRRRPL